MSPGKEDPIRLRLLWWAMTRFERASQWCRSRYIRWHRGRGAVSPAPPKKPGADGG
jgi:hypothetical protein